MYRANATTGKRTKRLKRVEYRGIGRAKRTLVRLPEKIPRHGGPRETARVISVTKDNVKVDEKSKIITEFTVSDASVHDSQDSESLIDDGDKGKPLHGDSAYAGKPIARALEDKGVDNQIDQRAYRNKPLTDEQTQSNREKSEGRVRVEPVFGFIENSLGGSLIRSIGKIRAAGMIGLINLTYNMFQFEQLERFGVGS